jgi:hypothetical protein
MIQLSRQAFTQNTRNILDQAAACDVGDAVHDLLHAVVAKHRLHRPGIEPRRFEQQVIERLAVELALAAAPVGTENRGHFVRSVRKAALRAVPTTADSLDGLSSALDDVAAKYLNMPSTGVFKLIPRELDSTPTTQRIGFDRIADLDPELPPVTNWAGLGPTNVSADGPVSTHKAGNGRVVDPVSATTGSEGGDPTGPVTSPPAPRAQATEQAITENVQAFYEAILRSKPAGAKGTFVKKVSISSTMGPGVKLEVSSLSA